MKKIWQKSLASMVSAALCLTAFVGCLTVNAATAYTGTITSKGATVAPTDAEATVKVTLASEALANTVAVQVSSEYGKLTAVKAVESATEYYVDQEEINLDQGKFFVHAKTNAADAGFATAELVLTFVKAENVEEKDYEINIQAFAGYDGATYNEDTIDYVAAGPIYIKVASSRTHTWDAGVMTAMPTTTSDGVITYTCECGETKIENFVVSDGTIKDFSSQILTNVASIKMQYAAEIESGVFSSILTNGGSNLKYGMLLTKNGETPSFEDNNAVVLYSGDITNTTTYKRFGGYLTNMNFVTMGKMLTFRPYVSFTLNEQTCYYYGATYSRTFIDEISANEDERSIALVSLYNSRTSSDTTAVDVNCVGEKVGDGTTNYIVNLASQTKFYMQSVRVQYAAEIKQDLFTEITNNNGTDVKYGMLLTKNGDIPSFEDNNAVVLYSGDITNTATYKRFGGYLTNMNFPTMGKTLTFRPYVQYKNSSGDDVYVYGESVKFVYIDLLQANAAENSFGSSLLSYYNDYYAK